MFDNKIDRGRIPKHLKGWYAWVPPPGYVVEELRDFTQPIPEDGSCALCGKMENKCPCYRFPPKEPPCR